MATYKVIVLEKVCDTDTGADWKTIYEQTVTEELEGDLPEKFNLEGVIKVINHIY